MSIKTIRRLVVMMVIAVFFMGHKAYSSKSDFMEALQLLEYKEEIKAPDFTLPAVNIRSTPAVKEEKNGGTEDTQEVKTITDESGGTKITGSLDKILKWANQRWGSDESDKEREGLLRISLKDYRGSVVFLNFWTTWCTPCREEMPDMQKLYNLFRETNFAMLAISIDHSESKTVTPFMDEMGLTYPGLLDPDRKVGRKYGVISVPTSFLIDCGGNFAGKAIGARKWSGPISVELIKSLQKGPQC
mgnify:CR=1 FL=1